MGPGKQASALTGMDQLLSAMRLHHPLMLALGRPPAPAPPIAPPRSPQVRTGLPLTRAQVHRLARTCSLMGCLAARQWLQDQVAVRGLRHRRVAVGAAIRH